MRCAGLALFGVAAVNVQTEFRVSLYQQFIAFSNADGLDGAVERFVSFFLEWKAVSLFSILFGLGLAMQFERLSRGGNAYSFLVRRLLVLLGLGRIHLIFIWNGDILTSYAFGGAARTANAENAWLGTRSSGGMRNRSTYRARRISPSYRFS